MTGLMILVVSVLAGFTAYEWFKLIGEEIRGHRRTDEALHGGSDSSAGDSAGTDDPGPTIAGTDLTVSSVSTGTLSSGSGNAAAVAVAQAQLYNQQQQYVGLGLPTTAAYYGSVFGGGGGGHLVWSNSSGGLWANYRPPAPPAPISHGGIKLGEIIGYRVWLVTTGGYLRSCSADRVWAPGEAMDGDIGKDGHGLGVHAWKSKSFMLQYGGYYGSCVIGSVRLWGEIVEHERGYRAQYAAIASIDDVITPGSPSKATAEVIERFRKKYVVQ